MLDRHSTFGYNIEKAEQEVRLSDEDISGTIYIGAGETHAISLIARTANKLNEKYPNIHYNFYSADGVDVSERLDKGLIDFVILFEPTDISSYDSILIPKQDSTITGLKPFRRRFENRSG